MDPRKFALFGGIIMLAMGVLALIAPGSTANLPVLALETSYGRFLDLFPMNVLNKIALIGFGAAGIWAASKKFNDLPRSITWARATAAYTGLAAVLGLIPATNTFFGYWPLFGPDVVLHAVFAVASAYFGFALTSKVPEVRAHT